MTTPTSRSVAAPTLAETQALNNARQDDEVRALVQQMQTLGAMAYGSSRHIKGVVTAINYTTSPPTVSINIQGETSVTVDGVRIMNNYSPVVGQTVDIRKQGADIVITGHTADVSGTSVGNAGSGWILAQLTNGAHNGNSNGDIYYRLVLDHGSWKMQWQGAWSVSGTAMIDAADALPAEYRPTRHRSVVAGRTVTNASAIVWDFHTDGRVTLTGSNATPASAVVSGDVTFVDPGGFTSFSSTHQHMDGSGFMTSFDGSHDHSVSAGHDHGFLGGGHTHTVASPSWASLNGVEYFL